MLVAPQRRSVEDVPFGALGEIVVHNLLLGGAVLVVTGVLWLATILFS